MNSRWILTIAICAVAFVGIAWFFTQRSVEPRTRGVLPPHEETATEVASLEPLARNESAAPPAPEQVPTAREALEDLWGPLSPEVEQQLADNGIELDKPFSFPPWEEVEEHFAAEVGTLGDEEYKGIFDVAFKWPERLDAASLTAQYPLIGARDIVLTDLNVAEIDVLVAEDNFALRDVATRMSDAIRDALKSAWQRGEYSKSPVSTRAIPRSNRRAFHSTSGAHYGWGAKIQLFADDYPEIIAMQAEAAKRRSERDEKVNDYLSALAR